MWFEETARAFPDLIAMPDVFVVSIDRRTLSASAGMVRVTGRRKFFSRGPVTPALFVKKITRC